MHGSINTGEAKELCSPVSYHLPQRCAKTQSTLLLSEKLKTVEFYILCHFISILFSTTSILSTLNFFSTTEKKSRLCHGTPLREVVADGAA